MPIPRTNSGGTCESVTGGLTNESLARVVIRESSRCREWMRRHGVHFQPSLSGTLHLARTNAFFMGGGKALVNAYYRSAGELGIDVRYDARRSTRWSSRTAVSSPRGSAAERIEARACVVAAGRLRVQSRVAARSVGAERRRRMARRQFPDPRHPLQPGRAAEGADRRRRRLRSATRRSATRWRSTRGRPCTTAASARASTACRSASSSTATRSASTTRARTSGRSGTRSGAGSSRSSPGKSVIR